MKVMKRYWLFLLIVVIDLILLFSLPSLGHQVMKFTIGNFREMLLIIPPVFILLGLMDVWVPKETMVRLMGQESGVRGAGLAIFLGAAAAGPLYGAFPVAAVLTRKGASLRNVLLFVGSWATLKIPMFLFETAALGLTWSVARWVSSLVGVFAIASIIERSLSPVDQAEIQTLSAQLETASHRGK